MKATVKFLLISLPILSLIFFNSCDEDGDTTKPLINLISPEEGEYLQVGDEEGVHLYMELSDNEMLSSYRVNIHSNFDDHGHDTRSDSDEPKAFSLDEKWDISGKKNTTIHHHEIKIPANVKTGNYHLVVYCTDAAGNESHVARNIVLTDEPQDKDHEHGHEH